MRTNLFSYFFVAFFCFVPFAYSETGNAKPLKFISSCELDLNGDNRSDIVLLIESTRGRELIILLKKENGYESITINKTFEVMNLSCHFGKTIKETEAGRKQGKVYNTPGTFIELSQPEGAAVVYFWEKNKFKEVWVAD